MDPTLGQAGVVYNGTSFIARAIAFFTRAHAFHVVTGIGDGQCVSADVGGVQIRSISDYGSIVWSRFPLTEKQALASAYWAVARVGRPYAFIDYPLLIWSAITGMRWPKWVKDRFSSDESYFCSELADAALTHGAGITVFDDGRGLSEVTPADFQRLYEKYGWWPVETKYALVAER